MGRKNKKRTATQSAIERSPIVNIKQRDQKLVDDLQKMNQRDAIKHSDHLMKLIAGEPEFQDLIFNIPLLMHLLKKYELEKKPGGLKGKLFKQMFAKTGTKYLLPQVVDSHYVHRAKNIVSKKFSSNPNHEDRMALAIARASLEMHGKVFKGSRVSLFEIPLFQITLSISLEVIEKISKGEKGSKGNKYGESLDYERAKSLFPRWEGDITIYQKKLEDELTRLVDESASMEIFDEAVTINLQKTVVSEITRGSINKEMMEKYSESRKFKGEILDALRPEARKTILDDLVKRRNLINLSLEKALVKEFSEKVFNVFAYLRFILNPNIEMLLPIYINQAIFALRAKSFEPGNSGYYSERASRSPSRESELLNLEASYRLGRSDGETIYKMGQLFKEFSLVDELKNTYQKFINEPGSGDDKFFKKIQKDMEKTFK